MRRLAILTACALLVAVLPVGAASATGTDASPPVSSIYLSLGDSVAAGTQGSDPFTDDGYTSALFRRVKHRIGLTEHVNLACPGDDTNEMVAAENGPDGGSACYGEDSIFGFSDLSQLEAAEAFLGDHQGSIGLITITIGANDLLLCEEPTPECVNAVVANAAFNLQAQILPRLVAAAPGVPIIGMNYYNPNLAYWLVPGGEALATQSNALVAASNQVLEDSYAAYGVPVADVESAFRMLDDRGRRTPVNVIATCAYTLMCEWDFRGFALSEPTDIHPSDLGYRRISWAFIRTMHQNGLL